MEQKNEIFMVMFGKYVETIRHFDSSDEVYDFIADIIKGKANIQHSVVGARWVRTEAELNKAKVYRITFGRNNQPKRLGKARLRKELEKRGLSKTTGHWK